jgi:hypothetical protein
MSPLTLPLKGRCSGCRRVTDREDYCYGCHRFVHLKCAREMPMRPHTIREHRLRKPKAKRARS